MKTKPLLKIIALLLISFGLVSCIKKLPLESSKDEGMLVIAHKFEPTSAKYPWDVGFFYKYILLYSPDNGPKIKIQPGENDLLIYKNFPAGNYKIDQVTWVPSYTGLKKPGWSKPKTFTIHRPDSPYYNFEIKPNHVTLLNARFIVSIGNATGYTQYYRFEQISENDRGKIIKRLAGFENSESWTLPDKMGSTKMENGTADTK